MQQLPETLRENVRLLGELLGENIREHEGETRFAKIEDIRQLGKSINQSEDDDSSALVALLGELDDNDILPIVRAFNQFLNLANMADQEYSASAEAEPEDGLKAMVLDFADTYGKENLLQVIDRKSTRLNSSHVRIS